MIKPLLRTILAIFSAATLVCWYKGVVVAAAITGFVTVMIGAAEVWFEWLKGHYDKYQRCLAKEADKQEEARIRNGLSTIHGESKELINRIISLRDRQSGSSTLQARKDAETKNLDEEILAWRRSVPANLNSLRLGWGARFETIGSPSKEDTDHRWQSIP